MQSCSEVLGIKTWLYEFEGIQSANNNRQEKMMAESE